MMKDTGLYSLEGRVALVTGAGSGIGKASAETLGEHGARIGALGHTEEKVQKAVEELQEKGIAAIPLVADVGEVEGVREACRRVEEEWGRLDVVFANAGVNGVWAPLDELKPEEWDDTLRVNLRGTFLTVRSALPMLKKRGGSVIITSSVNGTRMFSNTGATAYACSKAAQVAFAKMIAVELAPKKIRVNVICPGAITTGISSNTEQRDLDEIGMPVKFPQGKIPLTGDEPGSAEQVARLVHFLASDASDHITGTEVWVDGAQSLLQG